MRLDRHLSQATELSRSEAQRAIRSGRVTVAGSVERDPGLQVSEGAEVTLDGTPVGLQGPRYLMLHKPAGVVCSHVADGHASVLSLVALPGRERLHVAGRLDADTTGLVLLTDDGQWSHRVTAPRRHCPKTYRVTLAEPLAAAAADALRSGVLLQGEERPTLPAEVELEAPTRLLLTIHEGRYHQVKRMLAAVGNRVVALHRERIGAVALDPALEPGAWRPLTEAEIRALGGD